MVSKTDIIKTKDTLLKRASRVFTVAPDRSSRVPKSSLNSPSSLSEISKLSTEYSISSTDSKMQMTSSPSKNEIFNSDEITPVDGKDMEENIEKKEIKPKFFGSGFEKLKMFIYKEKNEKKNDTKAVATTSE